MTTGQGLWLGLALTCNSMLLAADICGGDRNYVRWRDEDAAYLLTPSERGRMDRLRTVEECAAFVEQFWRVRDPDPRTPANEFKTEHYRRIAWANERFAAGVPGWRTDRGRIYIIYGPPSRIESRPSGVEKWVYDHIPSMGDNVVVEFVDRTGLGDYKLVEVIDARRYSTP